ncbi:DUF3078 domain-containing protein [Flavobacterium restrictum]|uniref:DUF3078 domain-containing protein n=1 Tax=Flavobacterium restrictum TaxID=2594428 RepID=A0A553EB73_9FLAO|nr:DUF3078 domain-containing protein [Flavobacterium restrictum]TRX42317.1 DUF3078 domain-containing protein [Flavobacterium restrictum]
MKLVPTLFLLLLLTTTTGFAQEITNVTPQDTVSNWIKKNSVGFDISQIAFVNWSAGGTSSVSGLLKGNFQRIYKKDNYIWANELIVRYGLNKQDGIGVRKTDDAVHINSTFGYRKDTLTNWYHSAKFNFNTQFTNGYSYPNKEIAISKPFAPAYIFMGIGAENINKEKKRKFYISPFTFKKTLVLDQTLADQGAFGVTKATYDSEGTMLTRGKRTKTELGFLVTTQFKKEIFQNINFENRLSLYSDYLNHFGNIDIDWDMQLELIVNRYVKATIGTHFIYDDDIKSKKEVDGIQITEGPKAQLKQLLGIGILYEF